MFLQLIILLACSLSIALAQYEQPQYRPVQFQQPQYQQRPAYQRVQYQPQKGPESSPTAAQYPAGVDAQSCPNYPDCSNPLLAVQAVARASDPQYLVDNAPRAPPVPKSQYSPDIQQRLNRGEYIGDGDYHGEGLDEALAPEVAVRSQYQSQTAETAQYASQSAAGTVQYPAQQAASQYSVKPSTVQYFSPHNTAQYVARTSSVDQSSAQRVASQYVNQNTGIQYPAQPAVQYAAHQAGSQYTTSPQYITAPRQHYPQA